MREISMPPSIELTLFNCILTFKRAVVVIDIHNAIGNNFPLLIFAFIKSSIVLQISENLNGTQMLFLFFKKSVSVDMSMLLTGFVAMFSGFYEEKINLIR